MFAWVKKKTEYRESSTDNLTDAKPAVVSGKCSIPNAYSSAVRVVFSGSLSEDRGFLSRAEVNIDEIIVRFKAGAYIRDLLVDYYPAEIYTALTACYQQKKVKGMMLVLLTELLGSNRASRRIVEKAGFSQDESEDESETEDEYLKADNHQELPMFDFDRITSPKDFDWCRYVTPTFLSNNNQRSSLLSAMIHAVHAEMIVEESYPEGHEFYDPVAKLMNGYTIQQLLLQAVPPAIVMFALEQCFDRYPEQFDIILWRSLRFRLQFSVPIEEEEQHLIDEIVLKIRDNPSVSIIEHGISFDMFAKYVNHSDEYKKIFFEQLVRVCMFICPFPVNVELQQALTEFRNMLYQSVLEQTLIENIADLLLYGVSDATVVAMCVNHYLYFLDVNKAEPVDESLHLVMRGAGLINPRQQATKNTQRLISLSREVAKKRLQDRMSLLLVEVNKADSSTEFKKKEELSLLIVQSCRLGMYQDINAEIRANQMIEEITVLLIKKLTEVYALSHDLQIAKNLSAMGMTNVEDVDYFTNAIFSDFVLEQRRKSQLSNHDIRKDLLFYVYGSDSDLLKKILNAGLSPSDFILLSYQGDAYHTALCGYAESFVSRSQAEDLVDSAKLLSGFPAQLLYEMPVKSRGPHFFSNQNSLIQLKNFLDASATSMSEQSLLDFCKKINLNVNTLIQFLNRYLESDIKNKLKPVFSILKAVAHSPKAMFQNTAEKWVDPMFLQGYYFDNFLRERYGFFSQCTGFLSEHVLEFLIDAQLFFKNCEDSFQEQLSLYYGQQCLGVYAEVISETKVIRYIWSSYYKKMEHFLLDHKKDNVNWELIEFLFQALFKPYADNFLQVMQKIISRSCWPQFEWNDYRRVVDYVAGIEHSDLFRTGLEYFIVYVAMYQIKNDEIYSLTAEKILFPLLTEGNQQKLDQFYLDEEFAQDCISQQMSLPALPYLLLIKLAVRLTENHKIRELDWLAAQLQEVPLYAAVQSNIEDISKALLLLKLLEYQQKSDYVVDKLLRTDLYKIICLLRSEDVINYIEYLVDSDAYYRDGTNLSELLNKLYVIFQSFAQIDTPKKTLYYAAKVQKLVEVYPVLSGLHGLVNHMLSVGDHVLFEYKDLQPVTLIPGYGSVIEEIIASLLRGVRFAEKSYLRAHYRLAELFSDTYPCFNHGVKLDQLHQLSLIKKTLTNIEKIKEHLALTDLYKYRNMLAWLKTNWLNFDLLKDVECALIRHEEVFQSGRRDAMVEDHIFWLNQLYQVLQSELFYIASEDSLYSQLAIKFDCPCHSIFMAFDSLVQSLARQEIEQCIEFCDAKTRWKNILLGLVNLPLDTQHYRAIRRMIQQAHENELNPMLLYKTMGSLFIPQSEEDHFEEYDRPRDPSIAERLSLMFF